MPSFGCLLSPVCILLNRIYLNLCCLRNAGLFKELLCKFVDKCFGDIKSSWWDLLDLDLLL